MNYDIAELEDSLRRAFVVHQADFVVMHSRRNRFLWESIDLGMRNGWLSEQECRGLDPDQDYELRYRLTTTGRTHFELAPAPGAGEKGSGE